MDNLQTQCRHDEDALPRTMARSPASRQATCDALQRTNYKGSGTRRNSDDTRGTKVAENQSEEEGR